jgi:hypothetical protein
MDKIAQDRSLINKMHEGINFSGKILESINPEFQDLMNRLRSVDEKIRNYAEPLKDATRLVKSYTNRRDYLSAAKNMAGFHERCRYICAELNRFNQSVDLKHYKFLLDQFDDEQKEQLFGYDPNKEPNLSDEVAAVADGLINTAALKKNAGVSDFLLSKIQDPIGDIANNLTNSRAKAMKAFEKRFSVSFLKDLKQSSFIMADKTQRFLNVVLGAFKKLAVARAKRNVDQYIKIAKTLIAQFSGSKNGYHTLFVNYYEKNIVPLKEQHKKLSEEAAIAAQKDNEEKSRKLEEQKGNSIPVPEVPKEVGQHPAASQYSLTPSRKQPPPLQQEKDKLLNKLDNKHDEEEQPFDLMKQKAANFFAKIEKFAALNDDKSIALEILAFSEELEETNPIKSLELLSIAEGMIEKNADIFDEINNENKKVLENNKQPVQNDNSQLIHEQETKKKLLRTNIPIGRVDQKYSSFPILAKIPANQIKVTSGAAQHIANIFIKKLVDTYSVDFDELDANIQNNIILEICEAVPRGIVIFNSQAEDSHNPLDRQLDIYSYVNMNKIDPRLKGIAKIRILTRLSLHTGILSLRTIQKNIVIG